MFFKLGLWYFGYVEKCPYAQKMYAAVFKGEVLQCLDLTFEWFIKEEIHTNTKQIHKMLTFVESWWQTYWCSLYYFFNFLVCLKVFMIKMK